MWSKEFPGKAGPDGNRIPYNFRIRRSDDGLAIDFLDGDKVLAELPHKEDLNKAVGACRVIAFDAAMNQKSSSSKAARR
jgi:hypothetical protein